MASFSMNSLTSRGRDALSGAQDFIDKNMVTPVKRAINPLLTSGSKQISVNAARRAGNAFSGKNIGIQPNMSTLVPKATITLKRPVTSPGKIPSVNGALGVGSLKSPSGIGPNVISEKIPVGLDKGTWNGQVPTFKGNSYLEKRWDQGIGGFFNQFNMKDDPRSVLAKIGGTIGDQGVGRVFPNTFGNRSAGERIGGERPTGGNLPSSQITKPNQIAQGMIPNEGVTGDQGGPGGPGGTNAYTGGIQFPDFSNPTWKTAGLSANEDTSNTDAIQRRYALMQDNLRAGEGSLKQQEQDALSRRFASMGAGNSGAALRNSLLAGQASDRRFGEARNSLNASMSGEQQAAQEAMQQRNMAREQLRIASEEARQQGLGDVAKTKMADALSREEMDINRQITLASLQDRDLINRQNSDFLRAISMGTLGTDMAPFDKLFYGGQPTNPFSRRIQQGGGNPYQYQVY